MASERVECHQVGFYDLPKPSFVKKWSLLNKDMSFEREISHIFNGYIWTKENHKSNPETPWLKSFDYNRELHVMTQREYNIQVLFVDEFVDRFGKFGIISVSRSCFDGRIPINSLSQEDYEELFNDFEYFSNTIPDKEIFLVEYNRLVHEPEPEVVVPEPEVVVPEPEVVVITVNHDDPEKLLDRQLRRQQAFERYQEWLCANLRDVPKGTKGIIAKKWTYRHLAMLSKTVFTKEEEEEKSVGQFKHTRYWSDVWKYLKVKEKKEWEEIGKAFGAFDYYYY
jgi:hypothetical protein